MYIFLIFAAIWVFSGLVALTAAVRHEVKSGQNVSRGDFTTMLFLSICIAPLVIWSVLIEYGVFDGWDHWWKRPLFKAKDIE